MPLCADIDSLVQGEYDSLGHCYDPNSDRFFTSIIGSFYRFEIEQIESEGEARQSLVGYARIMKRNRAVCQAVASLFASGNLKFSFEIACGEYAELEDGTFLIDRSPENLLEGMCIVSFPACPEAIALQLVAELKKSPVKEAEKMPELEKAAEAEAIEEVVAEAETEQKEPVEEVAETEPETEAECKNDDEHKKAETEEAEKTEEADTKTAEVDEMVKEAVAEEAGVDSVEKAVAEYARSIAELTDAVNALKKQIAEMNQPKEEEVVEGTHPFVAEMTAPKKYSLLEKA